mmetsp:Transcript_66497/g.191949  ORF Transcript_66497/g.191949 Transcript_66497/m.191949 type:complete len:238 (+) Transcript_66497:83-796(+)
MRLASLTNNALCNGVALFTPRSKGTESARSVARSVTFGSCALNAERRNLKAPVATRRSVMARTATFCTCRPSLPLPRATRASSKSGLQLTTTSTSGTATPKARLRSEELLATATTSASGTIRLTTRRTCAARRSTSRSLSGVGMSDATSSSTSASQPLALKVGGAAGTTLGANTAGASGFNDLRHGACVATRCEAGVAAEDLQRLWTVGAACLPGGPASGMRFARRPTGKLKGWDRA